MTVGGTLSPFDRVQVRMMPAGGLENLGENVRGHSAVCAMAIPFTAWKHFTAEKVGRSTNSPQYMHCARTACAPRAPRV